MEQLLRDLRYGARRLTRSPGYTIAVVVTLALGIGANTAIYSVVDGVLVKPLPYGEGEDLVFLRQPRPGSGAEDIGFSVLDIEDLRARSSALDEVAEYHAMTFTLLGRGEAELVRTGVVSAHFFGLLEMRPVLGRDFTEADDRPGAEPVLLLSYGYWQSRFGADPTIVGQALEMNGQLHTVIGVLPPVPHFPDENDVYMTTSSCPVRSSDMMIADRQMRMMSVFGRAGDGQSLGSIQAELGRLADAFASEDPAAYDVAGGQTFEATPLKEELVRDARPVFLLLLACAGLVLLIACANVANLGLARTTRREREIAVRSALGAGRGRVVRQLLTEHLLVGVLGGGLGLFVAAGLHDVLVGFAARFTPRAHEAHLSASVFLFALTLSLGAGLLFGLAPAWSAGRAADGGLRSRGATGSAGRRRLQSGLVVAQVALAAILLLGCGLATRSFWALRNVDPGFDPEHVLSMDVTLTTQNSTLSPEELRDFYWGLVDRAADVGGVHAVGLTSVRALDPASAMPVRIRADDDPATEVGLLPESTSQVASEGYFEAMRIPLVAGRAFTSADADLSSLVAIVSESFAGEVFPGQDPIGRTVQQCYPWTESCSPAFEIVGVVADHRPWSLEEDPGPQLFRASRQSGFPGQTLVIRTAGDPETQARHFRDLVRELNPNAPVSQVSTLSARLDDTLSPRRLTATLLLLFGFVALGVSVAGVAGVVSFSVSQRTREIGVRIALGATPAEVRTRVLLQGGSLAFAGLVLGAVGAWGARRFAGTLVWGIPALDVGTWVTVLVTLGAASALACYVPARRATRVDPLEALRAP